MDTLSTFSSLADVLHALSQALLVPDIILLLLFAGYALFCIGSILMEYFTERRNFKVGMPKFLSALMAAEENEIPEVIRSSKLLNRQKSALLTVYDYRTLPGDALLALIRRTVHDEETRYGRITGRNNTAAKISPMLGLMGTLIPLGPGVAALGQADPTVLSSSLLVAFDTTVAGLAVAAVCMAVGKIRSNWYSDYLSALDSAMATLLQKIDDLRSEGKLEAKEPTNYAFLFEKSLEKEEQGSDYDEEDDEYDEEDEPSESQDRAASSTSASAPVTAPTAAPATASASVPTSASTLSSAAAKPAVAPASPAAGKPAVTPAPSTVAKPAVAPASSTVAKPAVTPAPSATTVRTSAPQAAPAVTQAAPTAAPASTPAAAPTAAPASTPAATPAAAPAYSPASAPVASPKPGFSVAPSAPEGQNAIPKRINTEEPFDGKGQV